jgi:hypothetical protein
MVEASSYRNLQLIVLRIAGLGQAHVYSGLLRCACKASLGIVEMRLLSLLFLFNASVMMVWYCHDALEVARGELSVKKAISPSSVVVLSCSRC